MIQRDEQRRRTKPDINRYTAAQHFESAIRRVLCEAVEPLHSQLDDIRARIDRFEALIHDADDRVGSIESRVAAFEARYGLGNTRE